MNRKSNDDVFSLFKIIVPRLSELLKAVHSHFFPSLARSFRECQNIYASLIAVKVLIEFYYSQKKSSIEKNRSFPYCVCVCL